jgi:hypothetical protein
MHVHWFRTLRRDGRNSYKQCRCGERDIRQGDRNKPADWRWVDGGDFRDLEPTTGPAGSPEQVAQSRPVDETQLIRPVEETRLIRPTDRPAAHRADDPQTAMLRRQGRPPVPAPKPLANPTDPRHPPTDFQG